MSYEDWDYDATPVIDGGGRVVAKFEDYKEAIACLPALSRILRRRLAVQVQKHKADADVPRGCFVDGFANAAVLHVITR